DQRHSTREAGPRDDACRTRRRQRQGLTFNPTYMRFFFFILLFVPLWVSAQEYDLVLTGGKIIDGTGNAWYHGDVAIKNGKIAAIGRVGTSRAANVIDVTGLVVSPGFI